MRKVDVRVFRPPRWSVIATVLATVLFMVGLLWSSRAHGVSWLTLAYVGFTILSVAAVLDALTRRVELHEERLVVVRNFSKREYPRSMFVKAQWGKGVPVALQSTSGEWVTLPGVGSSGQGLVNTLRAWLKH